MGTYETIEAYLREHGIDHRRVDHDPAATAEEYQSALGTRLEQQAKCLLVAWRKSGDERHLLVALPADKRLDLKAVRRLLGGGKVRLAPRERLVELTGCDFGELPPLASLFGLELILDRGLLSEEEIFFNAGRLDRSMVIAPRDLVRAEDPILL